MFSKVIRRTHMYLALFLTPWILMYTLSTMVMNHREYFKKRNGEGPPPFVKEQEVSYRAAFPKDATSRLMAQQILSDLKMSGAHGARMSPDGSKLTINRNEPVAPRRLTYVPAEGKILIERQVFRGNAFLERMHRRRGFQTDYPLEDSWAFSVDLVIFAMIFWVASGLWMWWEMKVTRLWGAAFAAAGMALFAVFLFTI